MGYVENLFKKIVNSINDTMGKSDKQISLLIKGGLIYG